MEESTREASEATGTTSTSRGRSPERVAWEKEWRAKNREKIRAYQRRWQEEHCEQQRAYARDYYAANKDRYRVWRWRSKYGREAAEVIERLYVEQAGACALCERTDRRIVVDHCHHTGRIRGLLCDRCNSLLGTLGDTEEKARAAVDRLALYLRN